MKKKLVTGFIVCGMLSTPLFAEETKGPYKGTAEIGVIATSGNTDTQTANAKGGILYEKDHWRNSLDAEAVYAANDGTKTAERYYGVAKSAYQYGKHSYSFVTASGERDKFSGFEYRTIEAIGYGFRFLNREDLTLDLEAGPGARQSKPDNEDLSNEYVLHVAGKLLWKFSETASFSEEVVTDVSKDAALTKSVTALTAQVVGNMAMKVSFTARHNSDAPEDIKALDTESALTLVYTY